MKSLCVHTSAAPCSKLPVVLAPTKRLAPPSLRTTAKAQKESQTNPAASVSLGLLAGLCAVGAAQADYVLPPLDKSDPNRCQAVYDTPKSGKQSTRSGQVATAVSGKVLDVRQCSLPSITLPARIMSGALLDDTNFSGSNLQETRISKAIARNADFRNVDLSNGVADRADFTGSNLNGANFYNAIVTNTVFHDADLGNTNFEFALFGKEDIKRVCTNPTLVGESREQVGCPD